MWQWYLDFDIASMLAGEDALGHILGLHIPIVDLGQQFHFHVFGTKVASVKALRCSKGFRK